VEIFYFKNLVTRKLFTPSVLSNKAKITFYSLLNILNLNFRERPSIFNNLLLQNYSLKRKGYYIYF